MANAATRRPKGKKQKKAIPVSREYDTAADAKNRISLRGAKTKYFHVKPLPNGGYVLEPRVLVAPQAPDRKRRAASGTVAGGVPKRKRPPAPKGPAPNGLPWVIHDPKLLPPVPPGESFYKKALPILGKAWARKRRGIPDLATNAEYLDGFGK
jgi:hypothetical protein